MPSGYEPAVQLVLPYFGLFAYVIGRQSWLVDASRIPSDPVGLGVFG